MKKGLSFLTGRIVFPSFQTTHEQRKKMIVGIGLFVAAGFLAGTLRELVFVKLTVRQWMESRSISALVDTVLALVYVSLYERVKRFFPKNSIIAIATFSVIFWGIPYALILRYVADVTDNLLFVWSLSVFALVVAVAVIFNEKYRKKLFTKKQQKITRSQGG